MVVSASDTTKSFLSYLTINTEFGSKNMTDGHKYSIEFRTNGTITLYQDGILYGEPFAHTLNDWYRFAFLVLGFSSLAFKNFKVYPI